ncbi:hypothetical protein [Sphingomonas sp.]|uniref:hypothetical protein n=1 Tax=Sphingomonas sp. TaxID=28214 RepID=UPI0025D60382|nr:hypothetical protein [Sphingomonas sp.]
MLSFTSDQWVIVALIFVLGLLVGAFLASGGGRKWKQRYNAEVARRHDLEQVHATREKDWREQDSLRAAALKNPARDPIAEDRRDPLVSDRRDIPVVDRNDDGVIDDRDR